jgi:hypothetical protein
LHIFFTQSKTFCFSLLFKSATISGSSNGLLKSLVAYFVVAGVFGNLSTHAQNSSAIPLVGGESGVPFIVVHPLGSMDDTSGEYIDKSIKILTTMSAGKTVWPTEIWGKHQRISKKKKKKMYS